MNSQIKYLFIAFIFFVLSCASFWVLLSKISENKKVSDEAEIAWQSESTRRYDLNSLERTLKDMNKEISMFETHFVRTNDVVSFLNQIEYLGSLVGVKVKIDSVDSLEEGIGPVLTLGISTSGSFASTYKFLTLLENSQYELEVSEMNLSRQGTNSTPGQNPLWGSTFRIKLFTFVP